MIIAEHLQELFTTLNKEQYEAALHTEGPLLVLAGAGTGKTKVLTSRIMNIISQNLATPHNILAVTFTNKAANEMRERINKIINCHGLNIGTFHSIAAKILRSNADYFNNGLSSSFSIINQDEQTKLIKDIATQNNVDLTLYKPKLLQVIIARWKDQGLLPHKISNSDLKTAAQSIAKNIYIEYQKQLVASNAVDFGDLLLYNNELFINNSEILMRYQEQYRYILIDEYQDTNIVQYLWTRMLASRSKNICCVGDEDQSIYSWRGAEIGNIRRFSSDFPGAKIIKLEQNYRSSSYILTAASSVITNNSNRHDKSLWTTNNTGEKIKIISCWNEREEAKFVIAEIERLISSKNYQADQIAILVRAGFQTRAFEEALISNVLPYQIIGGVKFYERAEIRDVLAYIRVAINNNDNLALERIINVPRRSIGNVTLKQIKDYASIYNLSVFLAIDHMVEQKTFTNKLQEKLLQLVSQIKNWGQKYSTEIAVDVTKSILDESGYLEVLKQEKTEESRARIENINEMLSAIAEFNNIQEFVEHSSLVMSNTSSESELGGAISVMTLHAAKGLEFEAVFLPGWEEGIFPSQKSLNDQQDKGLEEERRIAYVGITRAKARLYISFAERRRMFYETLSPAPSRFLAEIPDEVCVRISSSQNLNYLGSRNSVSLPVYSTTASHSVTNKNPITASCGKAGIRVKHAQFGVGIVLRQLDSDKLEILFSNNVGIKTVKQEFVEEM